MCPQRSTVEVLCGLFETQEKTGILVFEQDVKAYEALNKEMSVNRVVLVMQDHKRAYDAVLKGVKQAIGKIYTFNPKLGRHLSQSITTEMNFVYEPFS